MVVNELQVIQDTSTAAGGDVRVETLRREQQQEVQANFNKVARPCTWCNDCEGSFQEVLAGGIIVRGRALCNTCEKEYFICPACDEAAMWS